MFVPASVAHADRVPAFASAASASRAKALKKKALKKRDSDRDWVSDWDEMYVFRTNPRRRDTDRDGIIDGFEYDRRRKIYLKDYREVFDRDSDGDGLDDEEEAFWKTKRGNPDSDGDGIPDGNEDSDGDGIADEDEDDKVYGLHTREDYDDPDATPVATPTVTPIGTLQATPTRTPTPTPTPNLCFDEAGNTQCYGIPTGLTGNIAAGQIVWQNNCLICHGAGGRPPRTYPQITNARASQPQMMGLILSDQQQADVTAYTNRPEE